jgi:hypothetical protein
MKLGDIVISVVIDTRKLTEYALNPDNPVGGDKALMFQLHLGFTRENYEILLQQIQTKALLLEITGIEGQQEIVRTGWVVPPDSNIARLTTLYVRKRK